MLCLAVPLLCGGCRCRSEAGPAPTAPSAGASGSAPMDRLAPGELAAGEETAFGLILPRALKIEQRFARSVHARGSSSPEAVANYVRQRVRAERVELGAVRTVFPTATIPGNSENRRLRVEVIAERDGNTRLVVRDITPVPAPPGLSEQERWRQVGIAPDGGLLIEESE